MTEEGGRTADRTDLRMVVLGACAWLAALAGRWLPAAAVAGVVAGLAIATVVLRRRAGGRWPTLVGAAVVAGGVLVVAAVHVRQVADNPVAALGREGAVGHLTGTVVSDPRIVPGRYGDRVLVRLQATGADGRGVAYRLRTPVVVLADPSWMSVRLGSEVEAGGRFVPSTSGDAAALLVARGDPTIRAGPDPWWRGADAVRASIREAVADRPADQRALVPALVDGDDAALPPDLAADFRTTGLTHLLAVSGTNLTLVVGFLVVVARWVGVRGRWLQGLAAIGIVGFVLLARTEPSVLRAAAMGTVSLLAMGTQGRHRGARALGVAVVVLLLADPGLAVSAGFVLSVLATAGILLIGPAWRDALARWLPRWAAEAVAVPAAAQLACTPVVAALSGSVSLVAVAANLVAAPVVGPATVLGLAAGLAGLVWSAAGTLLGRPAAWCVGWLVAVARHGADLPTASVGWGTGVVGLLVLTVLTAVVALGGPRLLSRPATGIACSVVMVLAVVVRLPTPGWPPPGWVLVACDVGQGDALVLRAGPGSAVVVDAGPDPRLVDDCLRSLGVTRIPLLVLTHFHADHVDGLPGVLHGRQVGEVDVTRLADPPGGVAAVDGWTRADGLEPRPSPYGVTRRVGAVTLQTLWPLPTSPTVGPGDGSTANESSVVMLAQVAGLRLLLCGDVEPEGQAELARELPGLRVDVLKVPHHGSRYQDLPFLLSLRARVAVVSVGADNDYGHPAQSTLDPLLATGATVLRTDLDGDIAVVSDHGELATVTHHPRSPP